MIFHINKPEAVSWIWREIKDFCKRAGVHFNAKELSQWLRLNIGEHNPFFKLKVSKPSKESRQIDGFTVYYLMNDPIEQKLFVSQFLANTREAKEELVLNIRNYAIENNIDKIKYITHHDPKWMIERFKDTALNDFKVISSVLEMELKEE
jgi:hypothetical protein